MEKLLKTLVDQHDEKSKGKILINSKSSGTKNLVTVLTVFAFCVFLTSSLAAQVEKTVSKTDSIASPNKFKHSINMCPGGIAFGIYSLNYEYMLSPNHGLVGRFDYEAIPKTIPMPQ